ncbi:hypothetical protein ACFO4M_05010 [Pseudonocardia nematodicida]|uniref:hypothetical protein n=1 Tax=Pseudonocardia nematodicida TaxID=1206997 RepID=UPI003608C2D4
MSTPVIERPGGRSRTGRGPRPGTQPRIPAQRGSGETRRAPDARRARTARENTGRAKFVLVVMVLLAAGLIATLWLSTAAAADSYILQDARQRTAALTEQSEALRKDVSALEAPGSLAQRATDQGLVPVSDPARLVVAPDGRVDVVGDPQAAVPAAPAGDPAGPAGPAGPPAVETGDPLAEGFDPAAAAAGESAAPPETAGQADGEQAPEGAEQEVPADTRAAGEDGDDSAETQG